MIERSYSTFASSRADDHAFRALDDVARITDDLEDTRVVGGLMVMLLCEAFPAEGVIERRTADVDAAISVSLANSGTLHERLTGAGYLASSGNRYIRDERVVDLLVPSGTEEFTQALHGRRGFDEAPGLALALAALPVVHQLDVLLSDESSLQVRVRTPAVEQAVVLKTLATRSRSATKDLIDLYNLLLIVEQYPREEIGGWRLDSQDLRGARLDAVRQLEWLRQMPGLRAALDDTGVAAPAFVQLIMSALTPTTGSAED